MNNRISELFNKKDFKKDKKLEEEEEEEGEEEEFNQNLDYFFDDIKKMNNLSKSLLKSLNYLEDEQKNSFGTVSNSKRKRNSRKISEMKIDCSKKLNELKNSLKEMENENNELFKNKTLTVSEFRIRKSEVNKGIKKFSILLRKYNNIEEKNYKEKKKEIKRKMIIISSNKKKKVEIKDEDVQNFIEAPINVFEKKIKGFSSLKTEYSLALETRSQLKELEKNMNQLLDMFLDMYSLLNEDHQGKIETIQEDIEESRKLIDLSNGFTSKKKFKKVIYQEQPKIFYSSPEKKRTKSLFLKFFFKGLNKILKN